MRISPLVLLHALALASCARAGFGIAPFTDDRDGQADLGEWSDGTPAGAERHTSVANDTCEQATELNLSSGTATITVSTQGAQDDYGMLLCCQGLPDVAIRLVNPGAEVEVLCTGSGSLGVLYHVPGTCPSTTSGNTCFQSGCGAGELIATISAPSSGFLVVLCRDASLPPVTLELRNK